MMNFFINTGTTPIRRQYAYPTHLPRTEDRTTLVQLFKQSYEVPTTPQLDSRVHKVRTFLTKCCKTSNLIIDSLTQLILFFFIR
jgi:hypothetical protein